MHSANPRGGTPICQAPCAPPIPSAERQSSLLQRKRRSETQIGAKPRSLRKRGNPSPPGSRALPVQALPVVVGAFRTALRAGCSRSPPRSAPSCCIDWTSSTHNRANHATGVQLAGLRELPDYPTPQPRVNAPTASVVGQFASALKGTGFTGCGKTPVFVFRREQGASAP